MKEKIKPCINPEHIKHEFFRTPTHVIENLLSSYNFDFNSHYLDCCSGDGKFGESLVKYSKNLPNFKLTQIEIRESEKDKLLQISPNTIITDYLTWTPPQDFEHPKYVITNPPFTNIVSVINHSKSIFPNAIIIMLVPLSILCSVKRRDWVNSLQENGGLSLMPLASRPSFLEHSTQRAVNDFCFLFANLGKNNFGIKSI